MGIELTKSTEAQLFSTFLPADKTDIRSEVDDAGYCYHSNNGIYSAFTLGPGKRVRTIEISNRPLAASCKQIDAEFSTCLKNICLGQTRSKVENSTGKAFTSIDYPPNSDLEVIYYDYFLPLDGSEATKSQQDEVATVSIRHNIWSKFDDNNTAYYLGVLKEKDLP